MGRAEILMGLKVLKWQILHGSLAKHLLLRALFFTLTMNVFRLLYRTIDPVTIRLDECDLSIGSTSASIPPLIPNGVLKSMSALAFRIHGGPYKNMPSEDNANFTIGVFREIMNKGLLDNGAKSLCVGEGSALAVLALQELGFTEAVVVDRHIFFSPLHKRYVYEPEYNNSFDFVFSRTLDRVSVPARLVLEIERILRPGGIGAILVSARNLYSGGLIRSATPVSSFLKSSDVVHVCGISSFTLVLFKKRFDNVALFEHYRLPDECASITNNKPFLKHLEPLVGQNLYQSKREVSYLPKFMNISSKNRLTYVNVGAGKYVNSSITSWLKQYYPISPRSFNVYVVDHNVSSLSSYVNKPGITFVYHPNLAGEKQNTSAILDGDLDDPLPDGEFDFIHWFKKTIEKGDLVVLEMNVREVKMKLLFDLYESGAICQVDELFLHCPDDEDCMNLYKSLRNSGTYVHQWWGN